MLTWTDTHTHANFYKSSEERVACMQRAMEAGVTKLIVPGVDSCNMESVIAHCKAYPTTCFPTIGLHPTDVKENYEEELAIMEKALASDGIRYYGIGETGMDLYWDKTFIEMQKIAFRRQIEWALAYDLPLVFHVRNAFEETMHILKEYENKELRGVFHCFSGSIEQAKRVTDKGFYLGIGGVLTFKNSNLPSVVEQIPMDFLLLETDAPYLSPHPFRGQQNESSHIPLIGTKMAEIKRLTIEEVAKHTNANAAKLFAI